MNSGAEGLSLTAAGSLANVDGIAGLYSGLLGLNWIEPVFPILPDVSAGLLAGGDMVSVSIFPCFSLFRDGSFSVPS